MRALPDLFADYAEYHKTPGNKWFHRFGIPFIMLGLLGMLARVPVWQQVTFGMVLIAVTAVLYMMLDWRLGILMVLVSAAFYALGAVIPMWLNVTLFVLGWIFQFIGHSVYEHRQPAFMKNATHLLVGPMWILNDVVPVVRATTPAPTS
jgi:uncharacterized membrane protein YGL010W